MYQSLVVTVAGELCEPKSTYDGLTTRAAERHAKEQQNGKIKVTTAGIR